MRLPPLPLRPRAAHKGDFGRVLIVGGSRGMAGAPCLAARGALRGGAGLVKAAVPEGILEVVAGKLDECLTAGLPQTDEGTFADLRPIVAEEAPWADVAVLGPGIGNRPPRTLTETRAAALRIERPLVLDADALNALAGGRLKELGRARAGRGNPAAVLLTPHPGEMARLLGRAADEVQRDRRAAALACQALTGGGIVVLKGGSTVVTDGRRVHLNRTGNPGMATGGTGDVLSGLIAALLGQGMDPFDAARLAVHLHGLAGDLAARRLGEWSLTAGDLVEALPEAFRRHAGKAGARRS